METGWRAPPPSKAKRVKDCIICYFSIHWLKCGVDPISIAIVEVWKRFKGMKQHSLLSCLHSAHRLQFIVRNCGTRFKCNMVSLQSLIFVVYTYYLTLQFVDKFSVFPPRSLFASSAVDTGFLCPFSTSSAVTFFLLNSHPMAHPQTPTVVTRHMGISRVVIFHLFCANHSCEEEWSLGPDVTLD